MQAYGSVRAWVSHEFVICTHLHMQICMYIRMHKLCTYTYQAMQAYGSVRECHARDCVLHETPLPPSRSPTSWVCCSVLQCVAMYCSVLQCVAEYVSAMIVTINTVRPRCCHFCPMCCKIVYMYAYVYTYRTHTHTHTHTHTYTHTNQHTHTYHSSTYTHTHTLTHTPHHRYLSRLSFWMEQHFRTQPWEHVLAAVST